jgi:hypothetical protein
VKPARWQCRSRKGSADNELVAFNKQQRADKQPEIKLK